MAAAAVVSKIVGLVKKATSKKKSSKKSAQWVAKASNRPKRSRQSKSGTTSSSSASRAPVAYATTFPASKARISSQGGVCTVTHRELFEPALVGSTSFAIQIGQVINPANRYLFPLLSTQAQCWQFYRFRELRFHYVTRTSTSVTGSVGMAIDYNPTDSPPNSESIMASYANYAEGVVWESHTLNARQQDMDQLMWRTVGTPNNAAAIANSDLRFIDAGAIFIATNDAANANPIGKMYVEYVCDFKTPCLPPAGIQNGGFAAYSNGGTTLALPLGSAPIIELSSGVIFNATNDTFIVQAPGYYLLTCQIAGASIVQGNLNSLVQFTGNYQNQALEANVASSAQTYGVIIWEFDAVGPVTIALSAVSCAAACTYCRFILNQVGVLE